MSVIGQPVIWVALCVTMIAVRSFSGAGRVGIPGLLAMLLAAPGYGLALGSCCFGAR